MKAVFIKLGGSLITDKAVAFMIRQPEIDQLASEISAAIKAHPETRFFIGNGAGSFGHYMVHQTNWLQDKKSVLAISQIRQSTGRLNAVVLDSLLAQNIPAISFGAAGFCQSVDGQYECDAEAIINYANLGAVPLVYGDVIYDNKQGSRIIPTEDVLDQLAEAWVANGNQVISTIYLATVPGVLNKDDQMIEQLKAEDIDEAIRGGEGYDVTGGMLQKVKAGFKALDYSDTVWILDGMQDQVLRHVIGGQAKGTRLVRS